MKPRELVKNWVEAFNQKDVDRLAAFYAEDAVNHQVAEEPVKGRSAIRKIRDGIFFGRDGLYR